MASVQRKKWGSWFRAEEVEGVTATEGGRRVRAGEEGFGFGVGGESGLSGKRSRQGKRQEGPDWGREGGPGWEECGAEEGPGGTVGLADAGQDRVRAEGVGADHPRSE